MDPTLFAQLKRNPPAWLADVLAGRGVVTLTAGLSVVEWLIHEYEQGGDEVKATFHVGLLELLRADKHQLRRHADAIPKALSFIKSARLVEAVQLLRELVRQRLLADLEGEYSDLHGRALDALEALGGLDPIQTWRHEAHHREYAPLAFAFVRDRAPEHLPLILPLVAKLGFLAPALQTILIERPHESLKLLLHAAEHMRALGDPILREEFAGCIRQIALGPLDQYRLLNTLDECYRFSGAVLLWPPSEPLTEGTRNHLKAAGLRALLLPDTPIESQCPWVSGDILVLYGTTLAQEAMPSSKRALRDLSARGVILMRIFPEGDNTASSLEKEPGDFFFTVPNASRDLDEAIDALTGLVIYVLLRQQGRYLATRESPFPRTKARAPLSVQGTTSDSARIALDALARIER